MIGYDFDGVFVSDLYLSDTASNDDYHQHRNLLEPIFTPDKPYFIVTARLGVDRQSTEYYINKWFKDKPEFVYYKPCLDVDSMEYKAKILSGITVKIDFFVESDPATCIFLRERLPNMKIICFSELIRYVFSSVENVNKILTNMEK